MGDLTRRISLCLLLAPVAAAQRTWVVDSKNGPFRTIQAAVDRAAAGDIVLVRGQGVGTQYAAATITKGIRLLGEGNTTVFAVTIENLPRGERFAMKGFWVSRGDVAVRNCLGTAHFDRVLSVSGGQHLAVQGCSHVSGLDCSFFSLQSTGSNINLTRCSLSQTSTVNSSHVVLVRCRLTGSSATCLYFGSRCYWVGRAEPALFANGSRLVTKDTTYTGGNYVYSCTACTGGGKPRSGIESNGTTIIHDPGIGFTVNGGVLIQRRLHDLQVVGTAPGGIVPVTIRSASFAPYAVFASFGVPPYSSPISAWLDPVGAVLLYADVVNGTSTRGVRSPAYLPPGLPVAFQAVLLVNAQLELSSPVVAVFHQ